MYNATMYEKRMAEIQERERLILEHERTHAFTCKGCGKKVDAATFKQFSHFKSNSGEPRSAEPQPKITDGVVVYPAHSFITCSEQCRKDFLEFGNIGAALYYDLMDGVRAPERYVSRENWKQTGWVTFNTLTNKRNEGYVNGMLDNVASNKGFYLQGIPGCGKTCFAVALAFEYRRLEKTVRFISNSELRSLMLTNQDLDKRLDSVIFSTEEKPWDVVILDDLEADLPGLYGKERMRALFDAWYNFGTKLVVTSNEAADAVGQAIGDRVLSRMTEMLHVVPMPEIDYRSQQTA